MNLARFWAVFLAAFVTDQASKSWAERNSLLLREEPLLLLDWLEGPEAFLEFTYITNPGAAWSMFSEYPQVLTLLAGAALAGVFLFRKDLELDQPAPQLIFGLITGGIAGNLWDRLFRNPAEVVDFVDVYLPWIDYDYPIFNVADSCIFIGVFAYVIRGFRETAREKLEEAEASAGANDEEKGEPDTAEAAEPTVEETVSGEEETPSARESEEAKG